MPFLTCNYIDNAERSSLSVLLLLSTTCAAILTITVLLALISFCIFYKKRSKKNDGKITSIVFVTCFYNYIVPTENVTDNPAYENGRYFTIVLKLLFF